MSRAGLAGLICLALTSPATRAAPWSGSYAADGRCYCSGTIDPSVASRIVPTPRGGHSVARVCERVGSGPGLSFVDGRFDRVVYEDVQCGHGPFAADAAALESDCAGTIEPNGDECRAIGPRWDLAGAYARPARETSAAAASALIDAGLMGAPAAVPVMGAASEKVPSEPAADEAEERVVEIGGRRWREAPLGTPETGPPGTRIILDGRVYLDVEKADAADFLPRGGVAPRAAAATPAPAPVRSPAARRTPPTAAARDAVSDEPSPTTMPRAAGGLSAVERRARNERLLAEARGRLKARNASDAEAASKPEPEAAAALPATESAPTSAPVPTPAPVTAPETASAAAPPVIVTAVPDVADVPRQSLDADAPAERRVAVEEVADAAAAADDVDTPSPFLQALRLPPATRASSREFGYVDAMPTSYDYGGGGVVLEGSAGVGSRFRALARIGAATDYRELLLGGSWYLTPPTADRLTVVLTTGVETGRFELEGRGVSTELSDTGLYLGAASRFVVNGRFELQAGVGYSSFFEGDPIAFGSGYYHVAPRLDVVSRVELGDNDSLGIGVRYYY